MAVYDIGMFSGHGNGDPGACGNNFQEHERADVLNKKIIAHLKTRGVNALYGIDNYVIVHTNKHSFTKNFCFTWHLNAASDTTAHGVEFFVPFGEKDFTMENEILVEMNKLGFRNRGIKSRDYSTERTHIRTHGASMTGKDYYKEIRLAWEKGISLTIAEMCFITNSADIKRFNDNLDKIALICANAILGYLKLQRINTTTTSPKPPTTSPNVVYRVIKDGKQIGAYSVVGNVTIEVEKALKDGAKKVEIQKI